MSRCSTGRGVAHKNWRQAVIDFNRSRRYIWMGVATTYDITVWWWFSYICQKCSRSISPLIYLLYLTYISANSFSKSLPFYYYHTISIHLSLFPSFNQSLSINPLPYNLNMPFVYRTEVFILYLCLHVTRDKTIAKFVNTFSLSLPPLSFFVYLSFTNFHDETENMNRK